MQSDKSSWLENEIAASVRYVPEGHGVQVVAKTAALAVLNLPASQTVQSNKESCLIAAVAASMR